LLVDIINQTLAYISKSKAYDTKVN